MIIIPHYSRLFHFIPISSMNNCFSLPGIKSIACINALELPLDLGMVAVSGTPLALMIPFTNIPLTGEASCESTRTNKDGSGNDSVELSFQTLMSIPGYMPLAFLVTDVNNRSYLIGTHEKPWPYIESSQAFGSPDGESSITTYTISYKAPKAMIPCTCAL